MQSSLTVVPGVKELQWECLHVFAHPMTQHPKSHASGVVGIDMPLCVARAVLAATLAAAAARADGEPVVLGMSFDSGEAAPAGMQYGSAASGV